MKTEMPPQWRRSVPTINGTIDDLVEQAKAFVDKDESLAYSDMNFCLKVDYSDSSELDISLSLFGYDPEEERNFSNMLRESEGTKNNHYHLRKTHESAMDFFDKGITIEPITYFSSGNPLKFIAHNSLGELAEKLQSLKSEVPLSLVYGGQPLFFPVRDNAGAAWCYYDLGKEDYCNPHLSDAENLEQHIEEVHESQFGKLCKGFEGKPILIANNKSVPLQLALVPVNAFAVIGIDSIRQSIHRLFEDFEKWTKEKYGGDIDNLNATLFIGHYLDGTKVSTRLIVDYGKLSQPFVNRAFDYDAYNTELGIAKAVADHLNKYDFSLSMHGIDIVEKRLLGENYSMLSDRNERRDYIDRLAGNLYSIHATYLNSIGKNPKPELILVHSQSSPQADN